MMVEKFQNKYRIASARAQWWDYSYNGAYFITVCTSNRVHFFGEIIDGKMELSRTGVIADILWYEIPNHAPFVELGDFVVMPNHIHGILILNKPDDNGNNDGNAGNGDNDVNVGTGGAGRGDAGTGRAGTGRGAVATGRGAVETGHALSLHVQSQTVQLQTIPFQTGPIPNGSHPKTIPSQTDAIPNHPNNRPNHQCGGPPRFQDIGKNTVSSIVGSYKSAVTKHANRLGLDHGWQSRFHDHIIRNDAAYQRISQYIIHNPENWVNDKFYSDQ